MKNKIYKKGFTLIELLVVIAIIAILSSVVIVNLNSARDKGQDAAIKQQVAQIRSASVLYEDTNNGFGVGSAAVALSSAGCGTANTMFTDSGIANAITGLRNNAGGSTNVLCGLSGNDANNQQQVWILAVRLRSATNAYFCADSAGRATTTISATAPAWTTCP